MSKTLKDRYSKGKPTGVGGCACGGQRDPEMERYEQKCREQRIPVNLTIPAPTVDPTTGAVTAVGRLDYQPIHDGDSFDPDTFRILTLVYEDVDGATYEADDGFLRSVKTSKDTHDCLHKDEPLGVSLEAYAQADCCDGLPVCWPEFDHQDKGKNALVLEFINVQVIETGDDGAGNPTYGGAEIKVRGYIKGACVGGGYAKHCQPCN